MRLKSLVLKLEAQVLGLGLEAQVLGHEAQVLGLGLEAQVLGLGHEASRPQVLGLGLEAQVLGLGLEAQVLGLGLEAQVLGQQEADFKVLRHLLEKLFWSPATSVPVERGCSAIVDCSCAHNVPGWEIGCSQSLCSQSAISMYKPVLCWFWSSRTNLTCITGIN